MGEENQNQNNEPERLTSQEWMEKFNSNDFWMNTLPDELKAVKGLEKFKGKPFVEPIKSYFELEKNHMRRIPDDPIERMKWKQEHLGVPKDPSQYQFDMDDKIDPEYKNKFMAEGNIKYFQDIANKLGLDIDQAKQLWKISHENNMKVQQLQQETMKKMFDEEAVKMNTEWGEEGTEMRDKMLGFAREALKQISNGNETILKEMEGMLSKFDVWKGFARLGEQLLGNRNIEDNSMKTPGITLDQVNEKIAKLRNESRDIFNNAMHEARPAKMKELEELYGQLSKLKGQQ